MRVVTEKGNEEIREAVGCVNEDKEESISAIKLVFERGQMGVIMKMKIKIETKCVAG